MKRFTTAYAAAAGSRPPDEGFADELHTDVAGDLYAVNVPCLDVATDEELEEAPVSDMDGRNDDREYVPVETRYV